MAALYPDHGVENIAAQRGTFRGAFAMAKARKEHGDSALLDELMRAIRGGTYDQAH